MPIKSAGARNPRQVPAIRFTEEQLAERLKVARPTLRNWRSLGIGPAYIKMGRLVRYRLIDVLAFERKGWSGNPQKVPSKVSPEVSPKVVTRRRIIR
jgi:hypothetical protein